MAWNGRGLLKDRRGVSRERREKKEGQKRYLRVWGEKYQSPSVATLIAGGGGKGKRSGARKSGREESRATIDATPPGLPKEKKASGDRQW